MTAIYLHGLPDIMESAQSIFAWMTQFTDTDESELSFSERVFVEKFRERIPSISVGTIGSTHYCYGVDPLHGPFYVRVPKDPSKRNQCSDPFLFPPKRQATVDADTSILRTTTDLAFSAAV